MAALLFCRNEPDIAPAYQRLNPSRNETRSSAEADDQMLRRWLEMKRAGGLGLRENTLAQYSLEARRLLWYAGMIGKPFRAWEPSDAIAYLSFLGAPPKHAIAEARTRQDSASWRPLRGPLSDMSRRQTAAIVTSFFEWLVQARVLSANPFRGLLGLRGQYAPEFQRRFLDVEQLAAVFEAVESQPTTTFWAQLRMARDRFLIALLFQTGLRASEVAALSWPDFELQRGKKSSYWTVRIKRAKGGKEQVVPCANAMEELMRFRILVGLPAAPHPTDSLAVIPAITCNRLHVAPTNLAELQCHLCRPVRTRQGIYAIVQGVFNRAAVNLDALGQFGSAATLRRASTHWLRHSYATHLLRAGVAVTDVQRVLRHRDINTTRRYTHEATEDVAWAIVGKLPFIGR